MSERKSSIEAAPIEQPYLGQLAASIVDNAAIIQAMQAVRGDLMRQWAGTNQGEGDRREQLYGELRAIDALFAKLNSFKNDARNAELRQRVQKVA